MSQIYGKTWMNLKEETLLPNTHKSLSIDYDTTKLQLLEPLPFVMQHYYDANNSFPLSK